MRKAFTLIELMVVVVIIGLLASVAVPNFMAMRNRAREAATKSNMHTLQVMVEDFRTRGAENYPQHLANTIQDVNPLYNGVGGDLCVAVSNKPPYGNTSLLTDNVKNPFLSSGNAVMDITSFPPSFGLPGEVYYYDSLPIANTSATVSYVISGWGAKGIIPIYLTCGAVR